VLSSTKVNSKMTFPASMATVGIASALQDISMAMRRATVSTRKRLQNYLTSINYLRVIL